MECSHISLVHASSSEHGWLPWQIPNQLYKQNRSCDQQLIQYNRSCHVTRSADTIQQIMWPAADTNNRSCDQQLVQLIQQIMWPAADTLHDATYSVEFRARRHFTRSIVWVARWIIESTAERVDEWVERESVWVSEWVSVWVSECVSEWRVSWESECSGCVRVSRYLVSEWVSECEWVSEWVSEWVRYLPQYSWGGNSLHSEWESWLEQYRGGALIYTCTRDK